MAIFEDLQQCQPRQGVQRLQRKVVDDHQCLLADLLQLPDVAAVSLGQAQFAEQPRGRMVADPEPAQTRLVAQRGGQEALPGAAFAGDDEVLVLTDPAAVGQPAAAGSGRGCGAARSRPPRWRPGSESGPLSAVASDAAHGGRPTRHPPGGPAARPAVHWPWVSRLVRSARAMPCRRIWSSLCRVAWLLVIVGISSVVVVAAAYVVMAGEAQRLLLLLLLQAQLQHV